MPMPASLALTALLALLLLLLLALAAYEVRHLQVAKGRLEDRVADLQRHAWQPFDAQRILFRSPKSLGPPACLTQAGQVEPVTEAGCGRFTFDPRGQQVTTQEGRACLTFGAGGLVQSCQAPAPPSQRFMYGAEDDGKLRPVAQPGVCLAPGGWAPCGTGAGHNLMMTVEPFSRQAR